VNGGDAMTKKLSRHELKLARLARGERWERQATIAWLKDHPGKTRDDWEIVSGCTATDAEATAWNKWNDGFRRVFWERERKRAARLLNISRVH
jgi:hypothetical protein